jgi:hypothetical protein
MVELRSSALPRGTDQRGTAQAQWAPVGLPVTDDVLIWLLCQYNEGSAAWS